MDSRFLREVWGVGLVLLVGGVSATAQFHSADSSQNKRIDLPELLRVIQFFNSQGFHCAAGTEDGYAPKADGGAQSCAGHSSDYAPADWAINLTELLRLVQIYRIGSYEACPELAGTDGTEDGFCLVPPVAAFTADRLIGQGPLTVTFADASVPGSAPISGWSWDFGDGGSSTVQHPVHVYEAPGAYSVALTVTTVGGSDNVTHSQYIFVREEAFDGDVQIALSTEPVGHYVAGETLDIRCAYQSYTDILAFGLVFTYSPEWEFLGPVDFEAFPLGDWVVHERSRLSVELTYVGPEPAVLPGSGVVTFRVRANPSGLPLITVDGFYRKDGEERQTERDAVYLVREY